MELKIRIRKFTFEISQKKKFPNVFNLIQRTFFSHLFINNHSLNLITKDEDDNKIRGQ